MNTKPLATFHVTAIDTEAGQYDANVTTFLLRNVPDDFYNVMIRIATVLWGHVRAARGTNPDAIPTVGDHAAFMSAFRPSNIDMRECRDGYLVMSHNDFNFRIAILRL